tara:strand:+ start:81817 stop:84891 length:3075 start_codon:yes stop_codon:yes gene_type:complete
VFSFINAQSILMQEEQFGKNIVQYSKFDWHYIKTENFDIYYYDSAKQQAEFVAYHAEDAYKKIELLIGWGLKERRAIIVYNSHNEFQENTVIPFYMEEGIGGVTTLVKNRMLIPYEGSLKDFKHVIYHELVHVFINDGVYGGSIMAALKNRVMIPLWMNEGLAEYLASDWNTNSDMWLRDLAIHSDQIPDIPYLGGMLAYRGGQSVWEFITTKWGDEIIAEIFYNIKFKKNVNKGIEAALNINIKELSKQWHQYIKKLYWPDVESRDDIRNIGFPLTNHIESYTTYNVASEVSPDGTKVAIYSNKNGLMSIYLISLETGKMIKKVVSGQKTSKFEELHFLKPGVTWSPNSQSLAFSVKSGASDALIIMDTQNTKKEIIKKFNLKSIYKPKWNPKNNSIAFIGHNNFSSDVFIYDLDKDLLQQITNDVYSDIQITWNPNGDELLLVSDRSDYISSPYLYTDIVSLGEHDVDNYDIYRLNLNGVITRLTFTPFNETCPSFSPDGKNIAYISDESGINNIYVTSDNFKTAYSITNVLTGITQLDWYANDEILFTGFYKSGYDIFRMSNIDDKLINNQKIFPAKWKNRKKYDLLREVEQYVPNHDGESLQHYQFIDSQDNFDIDSIDKLKSDIMGNYKSYKYHTRLTLDYVNASYQYNVLMDKAQGMAEFMFSDILGHHMLNFQISSAIDIDETDFTLDYKNSKSRINWSTYIYNMIYPLNLSQQIFDYGNIAYLGVVQDLLRDMGLNFTLKIPFSKFHRLELGLEHNYLERKEIMINPIEESSNIKETYNLSSYFLKYVWDNTGYAGGNRTFLKYEVSPNLSNNDFIYQKIKFDTRNYITISQKANILFASRLFISKSTGKHARVFGVGGSGQNTFFHSDNTLLNPIYRTNIMEDTEYQYLFMNNFEFPVRGYHIAQKFGTHSMVINLELRLPFLIYYFPAIKYFGQLFGTMFLDAGVAWNENYPEFSEESSWSNTNNPEGWIMSYGLGPRFYFLGMPWKLDYVWQYNPHKGRVSSRSWYLSLGVDF